MLLPHDEFAFAELKCEGAKPAGFAMHEVLVRGHLAPHRDCDTTLEFQLITPLPASKRSLIPNGQPVISIAVTEAKDPDAPHRVKRSNDRYLGFATGLLVLMFFDSHEILPNITIDPALWPMCFRVIVDYFASSNTGDIVRYRSPQ